MLFLKCAHDIIHITLFPEEVNAVLVGFRVQNWRSIKNEASFSMLASQERQHGERLKKIDKYRFRLLPTALMFGGNAAGKSNFIHALSFMRGFILNSPQAHQGIPGYNPYSFDEATANGPSEFEIEVLIDDYIYRYIFSINAKSVLKEKLVKVLTTREQILFVREGKERIYLDESYQGNESQRLQFVFQGTQENELYLSNAIDQNVELFRPIYDWFAKQLVIINPTSQLLSHKEASLNVCNQYMQLLDTSVKRLEFKEVSRSFIPREIFEDITKDMPINTSYSVVNFTGERFSLWKNDDNSIDVQRLFSFHEGTDGKEYQLNFADESDGTKRLYDLLPVFVGPNNFSTIIIDEVDRSLHSVITKQLFSFFLEKSKLCFDQQIIATTHDLQLMTQDLFRRDEMWIFERRDNGTNLIPLSDFEDIRYDKDIRKSYLEGRMGGIPQIMLPLPEIEDCE